MVQPIECQLPVIIDSSAGGTSLFQEISNIKISKPMLMKYGVMILEVPKKTKNGDLEYFKSKMPSFIDLHGEFISVENNRIINSSNEPENKTTISEIIGVGVGLFYASKLLKVNPNRISKILPDSEKTKRLDYAITKENEQFEVETKGTTYHKSLNACIQHCLSKKLDQKDKIKLRFGTIALVNAQSDTNSSTLVVCDDPEEKKTITERENIKNILAHYQLILSFGLKSIAYNKFVKFALSLNQRIKLPIDKTKFFGEYNFNNSKYYGAFFDKRFIIKRIKRYKKQKIGLENLYDKLTKDVGETKYFIGIHTEVIDLINKKRWHELINSNWDISIKDYSEDGVLISDSDGILFVKSVNKHDTQIEENLPNSKTKKDLEFIWDYLEGITHKCGQPCRSWHIRGKPCEIVTFGGSCHYH